MNGNATCIYEKAFESFQVNTMSVFLFHKGNLLSFLFFRINKIQRSKFVSAVVLLTSVGFYQNQEGNFTQRVSQKSLLPTIQRANLQRVVCKQTLQTSMEPFSSFREAELHIRQYSRF